MGQYYKVANLDKRETLSQRTFEDGAKLTETCYVGNEFVNALTYLLANEWHGDKVIFCGDYAWEEAGDQRWAGALLALSAEDPYKAASDFKDRSGDFAAARGAETLLINDDGSWESQPLQGSFSIEAPTMRYVINETLGVYYDRQEAPVAWIGEWKGEHYITRTDPLTLFMALGNGLGGGDYGLERATNIDLVGSWAGHTIGAADQEPMNLEKIACPFDESGLLVIASDEEIAAAMAASSLDWNRSTVDELNDAIADLRDPTSMDGRDRGGLLGELRAVKEVEASESRIEDAFDQSFER